jgi:hypothetical protein
MSIRYFASVEIIIIWLKLSLSLCPKVNTSSGLHCTYFGFENNFSFFNNELILPICHIDCAWPINQLRNCLQTNHQPNLAFINKEWKRKTSLLDLVTAVRIVEREETANNDRLVSFVSSNPNHYFFSDNFFYNYKWNIRIELLSIDTNLLLNSYFFWSNYTLKLFYFAAIPLSLSFQSENL